VGKPNKNWGTQQKKKTTSEKIVVFWPEKVENKFLQHFLEFVNDLDEFDRDEATAENIFRFLDAKTSESQIWKYQRKW
jgi:hypothetical protein